MQNSLLFYQVKIKAFWGKGHIFWKRIQIYFSFLLIKDSWGNFYTYQCLDHHFQNSFECFYCYMKKNLMIHEEILFPFWKNNMKSTVYLFFSKTFIWNLLFHQFFKQYFTKFWIPVLFYQGKIKYYIGGKIVALLMFFDFFIF